MTEPGPAKTGYGALQTSIATLEPVKPAYFMAGVSQRPLMGSRGMPAAGSANSSAAPDSGASQDSALAGGAIPDPHREQPKSSESLPTRLACLESQGKPPVPDAHSKEAAAAGAVTGSAADAELPPDEQLSGKATQDGVAQVPLLGSALEWATADDWQHHFNPLQVALPTI